MFPGGVSPLHSRHERSMVALGQFCSVCVVKNREMASLCPSSFILTGSRSASSHSARKNSRLLPVSAICGSEECRGGVKATVRFLRGESVASGSRVAMAVSGEVSPTAEAAPRPFGVLFVCLGNICRSPTAEAVFRDVVEKRKLDFQFNIDSAGTIDHHEGNPADPRMKAAALKRGVKLTSISRPIRPSDFDEFDLILAMDKSNRADILSAYESWNRRARLPAGAKEKVKLMCSYSTRHNVGEVPDPYYGGPVGFEKVLDLLEDACEGLLASIQELRVKDRKVNVKTSP